MDHVARDPSAAHRGIFEVGAVGADQAEAHRNVHRALRGLAGRGRKALAEGQGIGLGVPVVLPAGGQFRGAGLRIPEPELREVRSGRVGEGSEEILDGDRLSVMALEIEVHALSEAGLAEDRLQHPNHLGALFVDGGGVEIADLGIELGPDRVGEGTGVLRELARHQGAHVADPLHAARAHVGGEFLVAEDGQPFLQAELEPVAAGDAVAGPIVEVLVGDHRLDPGEVAVGRRVGIGEHVLVVEDVEALVLHRSHVEVRDRDDHEDVEVVLAAEGLLVPAHRALERVHGVAAAVLLAVLDIDAERDVPPRGGDEAVFDHAEVAGDHGEEIRRLRERVVPDGEMAAVGEVAEVDQVAVGEQHRRFRLRRLDPRGVDREHVRPVGKIGDAAEAFGLALGAPVAAGTVEAHQLGVRRRVDVGDDLERERSRRNVADRQSVGPGVEIHVRHRRAVDRGRDEGQLVAVELERAVRAISGPDREASRHPCGLGVQVHVETDGVDQVRGRRIIGEADRDRAGGHGMLGR